MKTILTAALAAGLGLAAGGAAFAYDGTNCRAPGNCWEPKPGFPETIEGTEFDPLHDPAEISKQGESLQAMDARNARRVAHFQKTGEFVYDVKNIPAD
jgi:methanol dehydrogenase (cytochrome c) subunit 2